MFLYRSIALFCSSRTLSTLWRARASEERLPPSSSEQSVFKFVNWPRLTRCHALLLLRALRSNYALSALRCHVRVQSSALSLSPEHLVFTARAYYTMSSADTCNVQYIAPVLFSTRTWLIGHCMREAVRGAAFIHKSGAGARNSSFYDRLLEWRRCVQVWAVSSPPVALSPLSPLNSATHCSSTL